MTRSQITILGGDCHGKVRKVPNYVLFYLVDYATLISQFLISVYLSLKDQIQRDVRNRLLDYMGKNR
jgi:hypothetical protein